MGEVDFDTYESETKQTSWEAWMEAWRMNNRGDVALDPIHKKTARSQFERWWDREKA